MKLRNLDLIVQGKRFKTEKATPIATKIMVPLAHFYYVQIKAPILFSIKMTPKGNGTAYNQ